ncbi:16S rRNA (adenine(1518)-N(6)/adenine(1519)-N(6))-dimethyltransferase RsmA, partial [Nitrolancea hollandica]|uniref:16S rRNA (adenine(1518)-N(6)/adenine(1519)-N(6))- dimethyltransferase RsmA n=1 Tax=Nitrolancea hollandica TaxID=1206749 RepID=UPI001EE6371B
PKVGGGDRGGGHTGGGRPEPSWREILAELGVRPSKALGQNFLHDQKIVRRIAETAAIKPGDLVVEIGPGLGILTRELAKRAGEVIAVELDRRLAEHLRETAGSPNIRIVEADILKTDLTALTGGRPYTVVANLPYSIAAAAIEHLLESAHPPERLVVMVQREVAERIVARPPEMSVLATAVQFYGVPKIAFRIGPGAFIPAPKVESAVLQIDLHPRPPLAGAERARFFELVRAGFGQRRKRLANALASGLRQPKPVVEQRLTEASIAPDRRAETLTVADWLAVTNAFAELRHGNS